MNNCDQFREMYEAYSLGALEAEERSALDAHLAAGCKTCASAVEEARWLVSQLAYLSPDAAPSDMLKGRLMKTVRAEAQAAKASSNVRGSQPIPRWMWTAVAALLLMTLYWGWDAQRLQKEVLDLERRAAIGQSGMLDRERELAAARREAIILTDPASVKLTLASSDPQLPKLEAVWHSELGIVLTGQKVTAPADNRVLQLWLIPKTPGAKPIPSLVVRPDSNGKFDLLVPKPPDLMADTKALAITEEPSGGSPQPTTTPKWVGGVS